MKKITKLADYENKTVKDAAKNIFKTGDSDRKKIEKIFYFVRDEIKFGLPGKGDLMKASETIESGTGQCNTKSTLFLALCKTAGIPARIHFSLIRKDIQKGVFTGFAYQMMPDKISHSWIEVQIDGNWIKIDSFINDKSFYEAGKQLLRKQNWDTGYSISCSNGESSADFNIDKEKFVQMDAVTDDHGVWNEPEEYYSSYLYKNRPGFMKLLLYRLIIPRINRNVEKMRNSC
ncbi:MAG: transglutaminase domain-containing protein [Spirochaetes bacterium]|nr:transglutaminase domain-containing protein [Spirochaetota bacterium]